MDPIHAILEHPHMAFPLEIHSHPIILIQTRLPSHHLHHSGTIGPSRHMACFLEKKNIYGGTIYVHGL